MIFIATMFLMIQISSSLFIILNLIVTLIRQTPLLYTHIHILFLFSITLSQSSISSNPHVHPFQLWPVSSLLKLDIHSMSRLNVYIYSVGYVKEIKY